MPQKYQPGSDYPTCKLRLKYWAAFMLTLIVFFTVSSSNMRFTLTFSRCLVGILAIALPASLEAATDPCGMCQTDVINSISTCKGIDVNAFALGELSSGEQACACAVVHNASLFMKCVPMCPPGYIEGLATVAGAVANISCNPHQSGPPSSQSPTSSSSPGSSSTLSLNSSPTSSMPCSRLVSAAAAIALSAFALV